MFHDQQKDNINQNQDHDYKQQDLSYIERDCFGEISICCYPYKIHDWLIKRLHNKPQKNVSFISLQTNPPVRYHNLS